MSAVASPARCPNETQWMGSGRRRHSSGRNITSRCIRIAGHAPPCIYERLPSIQMVYEVALPDGTIEALNERGELLSCIQASDRAKAVGGKFVVRSVTP